jgi:hypothetical protein
MPLLTSGSSRVLHWIDTEVVDAELGRGGMGVRSYNFGLRGMRTFEQDHLLHHVLALEPRRLRWVFMEGGPGSKEDLIVAPN